jgi:hypothetical protein
MRRLSESCLPVGLLWPSRCIHPRLLARQEQGPGTGTCLGRGRVAQRGRSAKTTTHTCSHRQNSHRIFKQSNLTRARTSKDKRKKGLSNGLPICGPASGIDPPRQPPILRGRRAECFRPSAENRVIPSHPSFSFHMVHMVMPTPLLYRHLSSFSSPVRRTYFRMSERDTMPFRRLSSSTTMRR